MLASAVLINAPFWVLGFGANARGLAVTIGSSLVISTGVTEAGAWVAATCARSFADMLGGRPQT
jgi:hypothetical protein